MLGVVVSTIGWGGSCSLVRVGVVVVIRAWSLKDVTLVNKRLPAPYIMTIVFLKYQKRARKPYTYYPQNKQPLPVPLYPLPVLKSTPTTRTKI